MKKENVFDFVTGHKETTASRLMRYFWDKCPPFKNELCKVLAAKINSGLSATELRIGIIETEYHAGKGRVDILIKTDQVWLVIENKFGAQYNNNQLEGYIKDLSATAEKDPNDLIPILLFPGYRRREITKEIEKAKRAIITLHWEEIADLTNKAIESCSDDRFKMLLEDFSGFIETRTNFTLDSELFAPDHKAFSFDAISRFVQELYWILSLNGFEMNPCSGHDKYKEFGYRIFSFRPPDDDSRVYWLGCDWRKGEPKDQHTDLRLFMVSDKKEFNAVTGVDKGSCTWNKNLHRINISYALIKDLCSLKDGSKIVSFVMQAI